MEIIKKFLRGYLQTMLYGIEVRPKYKMDPSFYIILQTINQFQLLAIVFQTNHSKRYSDFKLDFSQSFLEFFLINNQLKESMSFNLAFILVTLTFLFQILLFTFLCFSTFIRIYTANLIRIGDKGNLNSTIQNFVISFNEPLHWIFVTYPIIYLQISVLSSCTLSCNSLSLIPSNECQIIPTLQFFSISQLIISYVNGQILIYIMRNHRFNELNSLKRRYSNLLLFNNTIVIGVIFFHYNYDILDGSDVIKYIFSNIFTVFQIIDQLNNYPFRDPMRLPAVSMTFIQFWIVIALTIYRFTQIFTEEQLFYFIIIPIPIFYMIGQGLSEQFQYYAIINANSDQQIKEKHLIITADYFYKLFLEYNKSPQAQINYQQFLKIHRLYCKNKKCYSQQTKFQTLFLDSKTELHTLTLSVLKCIFKTAQQWLFTLANLKNDLQFEQLQLQYISFVSDYAMKPLLGYIELRKYQNNKTNNNSIYFIEITNKLADQLQNQIVDNQIKQTQKVMIIQEQKFQLIEISLSQQWWTQNLYENLLKEYICLIEEKIQHWNNLINGYPNLNPFQINTQKICQKILSLKLSLDEYIGVPEEWFDLKATTTKGLQIKKLTHAQLNINSITLKLYSLFYSILMNDYDRACFIEQYVRDLTANDRQKEIDIIDNLSLMNDQTTIILVSMVKNKGKIVNKNQLALANFFHYINSNDFKDNVTTIHKLLPKAIMPTHQLLIDQYLQKGFSKFFINKIHGYYENSKGFIEKAYIKLGNLFEEFDDYVITASILKCIQSNQTILIDMEGKIIGLSEEIYENIKKINPNIQGEFFKDFCRIFLIFPQFLTILQTLNFQNISLSSDLILDNEDILFYIPFNLIELNSLYIKEQYEKFGQEIDFRLESQNLSSWRSWKSSQNSVASANTNIDHKFSLNNKDNIQYSIDFLQSHKDLLNQYTILRTKVKLNYQLLKVKKVEYGYFILELDHVYEITQENKNFNKYPSFTKTFELQQTILPTIGQLNKTYPESYFESQDKSIQREEDEDNQQIILKIKNEQQLENKINESNKRLIEEAKKQYKTNLIIESNDLSLTISRDKGGNQQFQIPLQKRDNIDEYDEFLELDTHFKQLRKEYVGQQEISQEKYQNKDDSQFDIDENIGKNSSNNLQADNMKNDLVQVLKQNREKNMLNEDHQEEELNQKRSINSSSKTSSSKSPSMLIRQIYSINKFQGKPRLLLGILGLISILFIVMLFATISIVQQNYDVLQTNINFVTFPETLNFYFIKTTYFSWVQLQQHLNIVTYSQFINTQTFQEITSMKSVMDIKLNELYQGIIQYENQIVNSQLKLVNTDEYSVQYQQLDLTQLIQLIQIHAFNFIENYQNITTFKDILFFRLNMPYVYKFAFSYITLLNENLIYYEDKIINDVIQITLSILSALTLLILYIVYQAYLVTQQERSILMLISRVSFKSAEEVIEKLLDIKSVLIEPSQLLWKKLNYFDLNYETLENKSQQNQYLIAQSVKTTSATRSNQNQTKSKQKSRKGYQSNSLAQRIYDLSLIDIVNYVFLFFTWLALSLFIIGAIIVTVTQVSNVKPTLNLNLQLIRFKFRFDSIIVYGEILKTEKIIESYLASQYNNLDMDISTILELFSEQYDGFQDSMQQIYDSLVSNSGLQDQQRTELLMYFEQSLCNYMVNEIPFCNIQIDSDVNFTVSQSFIDQYGQPSADDNNYEYVSGGIVNMVQEFTKTIQTYFSTELINQTLSNQTISNLQNFLQSKVHITQFIEYYLDAGKLLSTVSYNLFEQNSSKLNSATQIMQIYVYLVGFVVITVFFYLSYKWVQRITNRLQLMRLSLTLIPYEILLEQKTVNSLKQL